MVDWIGFRFRLVDPVTGEILPPKAFLAEQYQRYKSLPFQDQRVRCHKNLYRIRISPTCTVIAYAYADFLVVGGCPNHARRSWNEFSVCTPDVAVSYFITAIKTALRELHNPALMFTDAAITRLDIAQMLYCGTAEASHNTHGHMRLHVRGVNARGRAKCAWIRDNTTMIGVPADGYQFRIYRSSAKPRAMLRPAEDCYIRLELVLHTREIQRMVRNNRWTPNDLNGILQRYLPTLREVYHQYRPARPKHPPRDLPRTLVPAWACWINGIDLRTIPVYTDSYDKLCREFLRHGIDITEVPSPRAVQSKSTLEFAELLDPDRYGADGHHSPGLVTELTERALTA
jgi:hypothetical protein